MFNVHRVAGSARYLMFVGCIMLGFLSPWIVAPSA